MEALLGASHTLTHDLAPAAVHFDRALALDGGCVWAWNRSGWLNIYRGLAATRSSVSRSRAASAPPTL